ncbi:Phenylalanine--tRNA ligase alpha subunit [archaeon HR01]|nr:Phenylalanine--tRNA ligase alpha subunit [archaeon HR01]
MEKMVLLALKGLSKPSTYAEISGEALRMAEPYRGVIYDRKVLETLADASAVAKACGWLQGKGLVAVWREGVVRRVSLDVEGRRYLSEGFPERRLLRVLSGMGGRAAVDGLRGLIPDLEIAIIWGLRNRWVEISKIDGVTYVMLKDGEPERTPYERLVEALAREGELEVEGLEPGLRKAVDDLLRRQQVVKLTEQAVNLLALTEEGVRVAEQLAMRPVSEHLNTVTRITPELLSSGRWRSISLSGYDVEAPVEPVFAAKRHPLAEVIRMVKRIYVEMGFEEIEGPIVELAFWNFDALFQPQDHPAREMQDTFYLEYPVSGVPPAQYVDGVRAVHEHGGGTGSRGWRYRWSEREAGRLLLRTHTTATTIRHLAERKNPPIKVFSVDRIYRNEKVDWKHLAEFHQIEGIVVERGANLRRLMGVLTEFYRRLGLPQVRFRPSYFPYTEPSMEVEVRLGDRWLELGGSGIFRPETTRPFGVLHPVLAWGLGLERLAMVIYDVEDIRTFHLNDLGWLRRASPIKPYRIAGRVEL